MMRRGRDRVDSRFGVYYMFINGKRYYYRLFLFFFLFVPISNHAAELVPILGDYAQELRNGEHVDVYKMVDRLGELNANTYMWLIWHSPRDWDDLKRFLPLAREAGIEVWVYIVPYSETPDNNSIYPYSEPFKLDYVRWAEEIASLSLKQKNLVGYVIDDFWMNVVPGKFTPEYTKRIVSAGKAINPNIKFYPLMYFEDIDVKFVDLFAKIVDGVVAAYPRNRKDVERALSFLNDNYESLAKVEVSFPGNNISSHGDRGVATRLVRVDDAERAFIEFSYKDTFDGPTEGYHFMQFRANDTVMWEEDVSQHDDGKVSIDLSKIVDKNESLEISFGVFDKKRVSNFEIHSQIYGINMEGIVSSDKNIWKKSISGDFSVEVQSRSIGKGEYHLPMIVMPAGSLLQFDKRYKIKGTPRNVLSKVRMSMDLAEEGKVEGVVTYCLDKKKGSQIFKLIKEEYKKIKENMNN